MEGRKREFEGYYWDRGVPFFFEELRADLYIVSSLTLSCIDLNASQAGSCSVTSPGEDTGSHPIGRRLSHGVSIQKRGFAEA